LPALIQRKELRLQRFIVADMFETMLKRKWGWWNWWVYDSAGKVMMSGREATRPMARYKAARALFQLLLTNSRLCDLRELKPKQIRPRTQSRQRR
jgi:hypothetical protein